MPGTLVFYVDFVIDSCDNPFLKVIFFFSVVQVKKLRLGSQGPITAK